MYRKFGIKINIAGEVRSELAIQKNFCEQREFAGVIVEEKSRTIILC